MAFKRHHIKTSKALVFKEGRDSVSKERRVDSPSDGYYNLIRAMVIQSQNDILSMPIISKDGKAMRTNIRYLNESIAFLKEVNTPDKVIENLWRHRHDGTIIE